MIKQERKKHLMFQVILKQENILTRNCYVMAVVTNGHIGVVKEICQIKN